jgi:hypothetical protein
MHQQVNKSKLKIYDLNDTFSRMRELTNDEIGNIVGGGGRELIISECRCPNCSRLDPKSPTTLNS